MSAGEREKLGGPGQVPRDAHAKERYQSREQYLYGSDHCVATRRGEQSCEKVDVARRAQGIGNIRRGGRGRESVAREHIGRDFKIPVIAVDCADDTALIRVDDDKEARKPHDEGEHDNRYLESVRADKTAYDGGGSPREPGGRVREVSCTGDHHTSEKLRQ